MLNVVSKNWNMILQIQSIQINESAALNHENKPLSNIFLFASMKT